MKLHEKMTKFKDRVHNGTMLYFSYSMIQGNIENYQRNWIGCKLHNMKSFCGLAKEENLQEEGKHIYENLCFFINMDFVLEQYELIVIKN